jgi:hypothetical protein
VTIAIAMAAKMPAHQRRKLHRNKGNNNHCDDGRDACTLMMAKTPFQQGQQRQLDDDNDAIATRETTPSWIKGHNAIVTRATMPA